VIATYRASLLLFADDKNSVAYILAFQTFVKHHVCQGKIVVSIDGNVFLRQNNISLVSGTLFGLKKKS